MQLKSRLNTPAKDDQRENVLLQHMKVACMIDAVVLGEIGLMLPL
jgi:hypothetical protein